MIGGRYQYIQSIQLSLVGFIGLQADRVTLNDHIFLDVGMFSLYKEHLSCNVIRFTR